MPTYSVKGPDGRTYEIDGPEGASREQVIGAIQARMKQRQPAKPKQSGGILGAAGKVISSANEALIGGVEGIYNAAAAVTDPIAGLVMGKDSVRQSQQQRRGIVDAAEQALVTNPDPASRMVGRIAGSAAIPVGKIGVLARAPKFIQRAVQGAVGGAGVREVDESALAPAAIGAAANVVLPPIARAVAQPVQAAVNRAAGAMRRPATAAPAAAAEAAPRARPSRPLPSVSGTVPPPRQWSPAKPEPATPEPLVAPTLAPLGRKAQARAARFKEVGVDNPTTGMVTRDPRAWHFERETSKLGGIGDELISQFQDVERKLVATGQNLIKAQGGAIGPERTGMVVSRALDAKQGEMQEVTSALYRTVRDTKGDVPVGRLGGFREAFAHPDIVDDPLADTFRQGIGRRLNRMGLLGPSTGFSNGGAATINQVEELRKFIGKAGDSRDPNTRRIRGMLIDALDDDVVEAVGDDAFKAARASARARFEEFKGTFAGKVAEEGIAPELLARRILGDGVRISEIRALRQSLTSGTPEQVSRGSQALKALRGQALDDLLGKAVSEDGKLNGTALFKAFQKYAPKLRELLDPTDYKTLTRLVAASRDATAEVPFAFVNNSNTASALFNQMKGPAKEGWLKFLGKHGAAFATIGPAGNVALAVGGQALRNRGEAKAAEHLAMQVKMAKSPEVAAKAMAELQQVAESSPVAAEILRGIEDFASKHPMLRTILPGYGGRATSGTVAGQR